MNDRPAGDAPQFATDTNFSSGDFAGMPNKVRPADGELEQGFLPGNRLPAEHANYLQHDVMARLAHYDLLELTFPEPAPEFGLIDTDAAGAAGNNAGEIAKASWTYSPCEKLVFVSNGDTLLESYDGGYTWAGVVTVASVDWMGVAAGLESTAAIYSGASVRFASEGDGNAWAPLATAPTGVTSLAMMIYDPYSGRYLLGGVRSFSGGTSGVWYYDEAGSDGDPSAMSAGTQHPATPPATDPIICIAAGPTYNLYASYSGGNHTKLHRAAKADATATLMTPPGSHPTNEVRDLLWSETSNWFIYISAVGNIWISPDGSDGSWLHRVADMGGDPNGIPDNAEFMLRSASVRGSVITAMITGAGPGAEHYLGVSTDGGINWAWIPDPVARHKATTVAHGSITRNVGNRLAVLGYKAAGFVGCAYGARCGPPKTP